MYSNPQPNGVEGATIDPATINPAALNSADLVNPNARGLKRSRSPEASAYQGSQQTGTPGDDGSIQPRKRGRPMRPRTSGGLPETPTPTASQTQQILSPPLTHNHHTMQPQTPQSQHAPLPAQGQGQGVGQGQGPGHGQGQGQGPGQVPGQGQGQGQGPRTPAHGQGQGGQASQGRVPIQPQPQPQAQAGHYASAPAPQTSPPKATPAKTTLKALPTVRDHTTDQLGPGGNEYIPREHDEAGEQKVTPNGQLLGGREYRCRTFLVTNRGDTLFMLATECARVLGYRDSYLLFNKNRSLYKIIASQTEKDDLVSQDILPFSYRSRQIAIVTARSMFRQFGSRVVVNGRRVRDDYWEAKARKQGFTEADMAGEKRPGASKAREEAAAATNAARVGGPHGEIVYSNVAGAHFGPPQLVQPDMGDNRTRDYSNFIKSGPRQEITGPAYQDRTQSSPLSDIHTQAHHTAEYTRTLNQSREVRNEYLQAQWRRPHEQPSPPGNNESSLPSTRPGQSPHVAASTMQHHHQPHQQQLSPSGMVPQQSPQMLMGPSYSQPMHSQQTLSQAPLRGMPQVSSQKQSRPAPLGSSTSPSAYNYGSQNQMWGQAQGQPQQSPQHYPGYTTQSPHVQPSPSPQLRHPSGQGGGAPQLPPGGMQYPGIQLNQGYATPGQGMYPPDQTPRQFLPPSSTSPAAWSNSPQTSSAPGSWWPNQPQ